MDTSVSALKAQLDWHPLQERRHRSRVACFYKILNGDLDINYVDYITPKPDRTRRGQYR